MEVVKSVESNLLQMEMK